MVEAARIQAHPANALELAERWWAIALRGVAAVLFGIFTFLSPAISLFALVLLFALYALTDGVFSLASAVRRARQKVSWGALVFHGLASLAAGVVALIWPNITALVLLLVIAAWALVTGVAQIIAAIRLRKEIRNEWWLGIAGALSVLFGILMFLFPGAGALAVVLWIGAYALVFGAVTLAFAFRLRAFKREQQRQLPAGGVPARA
jgi:uncharacterized membrane protein HdeD (DUF308 family)